MTRRTVEDCYKMIESVKKQNTSPPMMQAVVLTLADGRKVTFTGPAQVFGEEIIKDARVTPPEPLPPGCFWGDDFVFNKGEAP